MDMKKLIAAAALLACVGGASAQVYVGGALGATNQDVDCQGASKCDKNAVGGKLYAGYAIDPVFALEAGYANFGKFSASGTVSGLGLVPLDLRSSAVFILGAIRGAVVPDMKLVGRLGMANVTSKIDVSAPSVSGTDSMSEISAYYGIGLEYTINKNLSASVEADFTKSADVAETGNGLIRMISVGAQYRF
jgi:OOP family OmpA-OmpF porin